MLIRFKFLITSILLLAVIICFFLPVVENSEKSLSTFDLVKDYFNKTTLEYKFLTQELNNHGILRYIELFVVMIFFSTCLALLINLLILFIPRNKSSLIVSIISFIGMLLVLLVINNIYLFVSAGKVPIKEVMQKLNIEIFIAVLSGFFLVFVLSFAYSRIKQDDLSYSKPRKLGKMTEFFLRRKKFGTSKIKLETPDSEKK